MSLGQVLMKWAHNHNELRPLVERTHYVRNGWWWVGFLAYAVSQILTVVSFISVTQAENAVIGTFSLVANAIFAKQFLGEDMTRLHWAGMGSIAAGAVMVLISLTGVTCFDSPSSTNQIIRGLSPGGNPPFFIFMMLIASVLAAGLCVRRIGQWNLRSGGAPCRRMCTLRT